MAAYFRPALFTFLRALETHNTREWFEAHRETYVAEAETPMRAFIEDAGPRLRAISRHVVADSRRTGGSMYRIYRDTRFSSDKSPYKTHLAAHFAHEKKKQAPSVPGFYVHLEPDESMGGGGVYHPDAQSLARIRVAIAESVKSWAAVKATGLTIEGGRLLRPPTGFDKAHPFVEDLKMKDFYVMAPFTQKVVTGPDFLDRYVECCERAAPLLGFLAKALKLPW